MAGDNITHFENLWEDAEKIASEKYKESSIEHLSSFLNLKLADYNDLDSIEQAGEIKLALKQKCLGEIIFILSALSSKDNINVYAALKEYLLIEELV